MNECTHCHAPLDPALDSRYCTHCMHLLQQDPFSFFPVRPLEKSRFNLTPWFIAVNILLLVYMVWKGASPIFPTTEDLFHMGASFGPYTLGHGEWWRLIVSNWLHYGVFHLAMNMWCIWVLGRECEFFYSTSDFVSIYFLTGISCLLLSVAVHPMRVSAGASGVVFGLAGVIIMTVNQRGVKRFIPPDVRKSITKSTLRFAGINLLIGAALPITDNTGHIGGLLGGLALGAIMGRRLEATPEARLYRRMVSVLFLVAFAVIYIWLRSTIKFLPSV